jgi:hypothetical protein
MGPMLRSSLAFHSPWKASLRSFFRLWLPLNCTAAPFESVLLNTGGRKPEA